MPLRKIFLGILVLILVSASHAAGRLVSGPMLGYRAHREILLWVETRDAESVTLKYWPVGRPAEARKLGFTRCLLPKQNRARLEGDHGLELVTVGSLAEAIDAGLA